MKQLVTLVVFGIATSRTVLATISAGGVATVSENLFLLLSDDLILTRERQVTEIWTARTNEVFPALVCSFRFPSAVAVPYWTKSLLVASP